MKINDDLEIAIFKREYSSLIENLPGYILLENKLSAPLLMVSSMGMLVNNDSTSRLAIKKLWSKLTTSLAKENKSLTVSH